MSRVVGIAGQSLAIGAEVGVVADSALVTVASNISLVGCTQRSITVNATVGRFDDTHNLDRCVDGRKAMASMLVACGINARGAVVEIGA